MPPSRSIPRPTEVFLPPWRLAFVLALTVLLSVAARSWHNALLAVDAPLSEWTRGNNMVAGLARSSALGAARVSLLLAGLVGALTWRRCPALAVVYPATVAAGLVVNALMKTVIDRPRPPVPATGVALASFPSGHVIQVTLALGLLPPVIYLLSNKRWLFWLATVVLGAGVAGVSIARVQLGAHWPTDVVGGVLVGTMLLLVADMALRYWRTAHHCRGCALHPEARSRAEGL